MSLLKLFKRLSKMCLIIAGGGCLLLLAIFLLTSVMVPWKRIVELSDAPSANYTVVIVPGASVLRNGTPSDVLTDRLLTALDLYQAGKVKTFLLSGDHGQDGYDEVSVMRDFLLDRGVPGEDLFLDHAGFDTYDTLYRAVHIFGITQGAMIVTQRFHLPRAMLIADGLGMFETTGVIADRQTYLKASVFSAREWPARVKALFDVIFKSKPKYLGDPIDITGDGRVTWDK